MQLYLENKPIALWIDQGNPNEAWGAILGTAPIGQTD